MNLLQVANDYRDVWVEIGSQIIGEADPKRTYEVWEAMVDALNPIFENKGSADVAAACAVYMAFISFELSKQVTNDATGERVPSNICLMALANMANANLMTTQEFRAKHGDKDAEKDSEEKSDQEEGREDSPGSND